MSVLVGVVMGSDSDWPVMADAAAALAEFGVGYEADVVSAHRMPHEMIRYGSDAAGRDLRVLIAGAGGAAHLPGMLAAVTPSSAASSSAIRCACTARLAGSPGAGASTS